MFDNKLLPDDYKSPERLSKLEKCLKTVPSFEFKLIRRVSFLPYLQSHYPTVSEPEKIISIEGKKALSFKVCE